MRIRAVKGILLLILILSHILPNPVFARGGFQKDVAEVEVEYGIRGYIRVNSLLRLGFRFKNVKRDFKGKIEIQYYSDDLTRCNIVKEIELKKGKNENKSFYPYLSSKEPYFKMRIFDSLGNKVWSKTSDIEFFDTDSSSEIVIGELESAGEGISFNGKEAFHITRMRIQTEDFYDSHKGLAPVDLLIIPNGYLQTGDPKTVKLIEERIKVGGLVTEERNIKKIDLNRVYLSKEDREDWLWRIEKVVNSMLKKISIHSGRFILIFIIYILVISPITYLILLKKKKKDFYYFAIPVISLVFTGIVYMAGSDSRISGLRINYISVLDLRKGKSYEHSFFAITNSTNRSYDVNVSNNYIVEPAYGVHSSNKTKDNLDEKLKRKVLESNNKTEIRIGKGTAFETVYFKAEGTPEVRVQSMGNLYRKDGVIKGEFINRLGVPLDKVFAIYDDEIIYLGRVEPLGRKMIDTQKDDVFLNDLTSHINDERYIRDAFGDFKEESEVSKELLMTGLMSKLTVREFEEPIFVGLSKERVKGEFSNKIKVEGGYTLVLLSAEKMDKETLGGFINSLNKLQYQVEGDSMVFLNNAFLNRGSITVTYKLPHNNYNIMSYFRRYNSKVNPCTISLKNVKNEKFDIIFTPDEGYLEEIKRLAKNTGNVERDVKEEDDMRFIGLKRYIKDGEITVKYEITQKDYEILTSYTIPIIPKLSLE